MKKLFNYRKLLVLLLFVFAFNYTFSKTNVNIDGNINIRIGKNSSNRNSTYYKKQKAVGNIDDDGYLYKKFVINKILYFIAIDEFKNKYIIKTVFWNNNPSSGIYYQEAYSLNRHSNNCLSIEDDEDYCFTINYDGRPALYNRVEARYWYYGYFVD